MVVVGSSRCGFDDGVVVTDDNGSTDDVVDFSFLVEEEDTTVKKDASVDCRTVLMLVLVLVWFLVGRTDDSLAMPSFDGGFVVVVVVFFVFDVAVPTIGGFFVRRIAVVVLVFVE
jgi:hypothetical protein